MINKIKIIFSWLLVLIVAVLIFNFSAENAETSSQTSEGVVVEILGTVMDKEDITPEIVTKFHFPIRKIAHFGIYMLLGFCLLNATKHSFKIKTLFNLIISFVIAVIYATLDELHQNFSAGRGPKATDVLIDASGALIGILLFWLAIFLIDKITLKAESRKK